MQPTALQLVYLAIPYFSSDDSARAAPGPTFEDLGHATESLAHLRNLPYAARRQLLQRVGVPPGLPTVVYLRALQHVVTRKNGLNASLSMPNCLHPLRSSTGWNPTDRYVSVFEQQVETSTQHKAEEVEDQQSTVRKTLLGIRNQGSTCYLNSLLQLLFHLDRFRSVVYQMATEDETEGRSMPLALQRLFFALQTSSTAQDTRELTESFGWSARDAFVQHDIHELTRKLIDSLEHKLAGTTQADAMKQLFCGEVENVVEVPEIKFQNVTREPFYDLQLVVSGKRTIYESIEDMLKVNHLTEKYLVERKGESNSYHPARMATRISKLPPVLLMHLTRFEYDPQRGDVGKILSRMEYYSVIDLHRFVPQLPPDDTRYQLHSVLVHSGLDAGCGHYYCYVNCDGTWIKFNDSAVTRVARWEVFGASFGGVAVTDWGTEVMLNVNAYMLAYVRQKDAPSLTTLPQDHEIPLKLRTRLKEEAVLRQQKEKEEAEDHLYTRIHCFTCAGIRKHAEWRPFFLSQSAPGMRPPPEQTLRAPKTAMLSACLPQFLHKRLKVPLSHPFVWHMNACKGTTRLGGLLQFNNTADELAAGARDTCVLVSMPGECDGAPSGPSCEHWISHHFVYDPEALAIGYEVSLVSTVPYKADGEVQEAPGVRTLRSRLPRAAATLLPAVYMEVGSRELTEVDGPVVNGGQYVWQVAGDSPFLHLYPNPSAFQKFYSAVRVEVREAIFPYSPLCICQLPLSMPYEFIQRYIARELKLEEFDLIRLSRHNPETDAPFFAKKKKKDAVMLKHLLFAANCIQRILYYEVGKHTVTELEASNPLEFDYFDTRVRYVGTHMVLMPQPGAFTIPELLESCAARVGLSAEEGKLLELVDVWKGRIFNVHGHNDPPLQKPFEESAEYRIELAPKPLPDVAADDQLLIPVQHFSLADGKVKTHSDPFRMWLSKADTEAAIRQRIAARLEVHEQVIASWKMWVVVGDTLTEVRTTIEAARSNRKASVVRTGRSKSAAEVEFLGLEHAPTSQRRGEAIRQGASLQIATGS